MTGFIALLTIEQKPESVFSHTFMPFPTSSLSLLNIWLPLEILAFTFGAATLPNSL